MPRATMGLSMVPDLVVSSLANRIPHSMDLRLAPPIHSLYRRPEGCSGGVTKGATAATHCHREHDSHEAFVWGILGTQLYTVTENMIAMKPLCGGS